MDLRSVQDVKEEVKRMDGWMEFNKIFKMSFCTVFS